MDFAPNIPDMTLNLSGEQARRLNSYMRQLRQYGARTTRKLAIADISRDPESKHALNNKVHIDHSAALTTTNKYLQVKCAYPSPKVPHSGNRALSMCERAALSGVVWSSVADTMTNTDLAIRRFPSTWQASFCNKSFTGGRVSRRGACPHPSGVSWLQRVVRHG